MRQSSLQLVMIVPLIKMKGTTAPANIEHRHISSTGAALVSILKWYSALWTSDVVLNFSFLFMVNRESVTPAFDRLIGRG
jgi:hypothetical protein